MEDIERKSDMYELNLKFDYNATKEYREEYEELCDCAYCRNYYKGFKSKYPKTATFIKRFGLDVNNPLEIMPHQYNKKDNKFEYTSYYPVKGEIFEDKININMENLQIFLMKGSHRNNPCPNPHMEEPYFLIEITDIKLHWTLSEEIE